MPDNEIEVTSMRATSIKQRTALYSILAKEEEYSNLSDYLSVDKEVTENVSRELVNSFENKTFFTPEKVMQVLQYDIQGYPTGLIAKTMGITPQQVTDVKRSDSYKLAKDEVLRSVIDGARKYMEVASIKAVKTLVQCLDSNSEKVRLAAAQDILNRSGLSAPQQIEITSTVNNFENFSDAELAEILKKESAIPKNAEVISIVPSAVIEG